MAYYGSMYEALSEAFPNIGLDESKFRKQSMYKQDLSCEEKSILLYLFLIASLQIKLTRIATKCTGVIR
jgi:hypothetical protein